MNRIRKNFMSYKGRQEPKRGQRVKIYKNLHNGLWSVKDSKTGLVLGHTNEITLANCTYTVGQQTRLRVIESGQKEVHAYVNGLYVADTFMESLQDAYDVKHVTYNPYKENHFTTLESERKEVVKRSDGCTMLAEKSLVLSF